MFDKKMFQLLLNRWCHFNLYLYESLRDGILLAADMGSFLYNIVGQMSNISGLLQQIFLVSVIEREDNQVRGTADFSFTDLP